MSGSEEYDLKKYEDQWKELYELVKGKSPWELPKVLVKHPEFQEIFPPPKIDDEVTKKILQEIREHPSKKIQESFEHYLETRESFKHHVMERSRRLSKISIMQPREKAEIDEKKKTGKKSPKRVGNPLPELGPNYPPSIFEVTPCTSSFDPKEVSLVNSKGKLSQEFYKVLVFNNRWEPTYFEHNGWYTGMILRYNQEWLPSGYEIGDLVQSYSLIPGEEMVVEMSSWEKTRSEIEQMAAGDDKTRHETSSKTTDTKQIIDKTIEKEGWKVDGKAKIGFGFGSASLGGSKSSSVENHAEDMTSNVQEETQVTATEISHSRSVRVATTKESGSEERVTRTLKNPNRCHAVTYNFYQLLKRFDVVMTYLDSPLCLIYPCTTMNFWATLPYFHPTPQFFEFRQLLSAFGNLHSRHNMLPHFLKRNKDVEDYLASVSSDGMWSIFHYGLWGPTRPCENFGIPIVLEATTYDPVELRDIIAYFFMDLWNQPNALTIPEDLDLLDSVIAGYLDMDAQIRLKEENLNDQIVETITVLTPGLYVDAMLGVCSGCEDFLNLSRSNEALRDFESARQVHIENELMEKEILRRQALLDAGTLDPFEPTPPDEDDDGSCHDGRR